MVRIRYALLLFVLSILSLVAHGQIGPTPGGSPTGPASGCLTGTYPAPGLSSGCLTAGALPSAPAAGYAPVSTAPGTSSYTAQPVPSQVYTTARQTYVLEDYLSTADGQSGTDYGYAAINFCASVGCPTLTTPVGLKTTHEGICKVYTSLVIPAPIHFDASSCTLIPQSTMGSSYISLANCSTTIGSTVVTCTSTAGLQAGMAIGGDPTVGPENYVFSVTSGTTFVLALPALRTFQALLTSSSTAVLVADTFQDAVTGQSVTGPGVPASTTIIVNQATHTFTLSNSATIGTTSPVDLALASGTVVSGLGLSAITVKPVIIVPPSANLSTSQARPHGPNYGVWLDNIMIQDPNYGYAHNSFGRSLLGVAGIQVYGQDNLVIHRAQINGLVGSALIYGGVTPSVPTGAVRESDAYDIYAYSDGDFNTGQACVSLMTGYGQGIAGQDENNQLGFHNVHCVYADAEGLVLGTYLHPGTANGPRLITFDGDNQFEGGADQNYSFSSTDTVRILSAGSHNEILGGEWTTPGFSKSVFHISQGIDLNVSGLTMGGNGGQAQTFNVTLVPSGTTVTYVSAGTNAGNSFMVGPYWNGIGAQIFDTGACSAGCNVYLANINAVNGSGTVLTLASAYTGSATSGTITVQAGGSYFHLDQTNSLTSPLKVLNGTYTDVTANVLSLLGMTTGTQAFVVGTGAMSTPPGQINDYQGVSNTARINMLPQGYTSNSQSGPITFQSTFLNSAGVYQRGGMTEYFGASTGVNPTQFLYYTCAICNGDFYNNVQNSFGVYQALNSTSTNRMAFTLTGVSQGWEWGMPTVVSGNPWRLIDTTNNVTAISVAPSTGAVTLSSIGAGTNPVCPNGIDNALTTSGCVTVGNTTNLLTMNNSGSGASSGAAFNGSSAVTLSYNTIGAAPSVTTSSLGPFWGVDSGSATAYVVTSTPTNTLQSGLSVCFLPSNNNSGSTPTLNWNSTGIKTITQLGNNPTAASTMQTTAPSCMIYNGTNWILQNSAQPNAFYVRGTLYPALTNTPSLVHMDYWNIQPTLFSTSTMLSTTYLETNASRILALTARLSGTISCTVAPTVAVVDLGTSVTTVYGSGTVLQSLVTGTADGSFTTGAISVSVTAGHYIGIGFSAGTCITSPTFDISTTMQ